MNSNIFTLVRGAETQSHLPLFGKVLVQDSCSVQSMTIAQRSEIASVDRDGLFVLCFLVVVKWSLTLPSLHNKLVVLNFLRGPVMCSCNEF